MSTPEQPGTDRPATSPEQQPPAAPVAPAQPSVVPPSAAPRPPVPPAPPVEPVAPPSSGWGEAPRYGQYGPVPPTTPAPPAYGQTAPGAPGYGSQPGYGAQQPGDGAQTPYGMPMSNNPWRPQAEKPGIIPLRPLTLGEIYDGAFSAVRHNPKVMLGLATLVILVATVIGTLVGYLLTPAMTSWLGPIFDDPALTEAGFDLGFGAGDIAQLYAMGAGSAVTFLLAGPVVNGLLTVSVSRSVLGDRASVRQVWDRVGPRVWLLVGWSVLQALLIVVVSAVLVTVVVLAAVGLSDVSGALAGWTAVILALATVFVLIWLATRLLLVPPALALENAGLFTTVRRAWVLTRGSFWRVFGINLLASIIVGVISQVVAVPLSILGGLFSLGGDATAALTVTTVITTVVSTAITTIFLAGVVALIYVDLRMRREGLDVTLAASAASNAEHKG